MRKRGNGPKPGAVDSEGGVVLGGIRFKSWVKLREFQLNMGEISFRQPLTERIFRIVVRVVRYAQGALKLDPQAARELNRLVPRYLGGGAEEPSRREVAVYHLLPAARHLIEVVEHTLVARNSKFFAVCYGYFSRIPDGDAPTDGLGKRNVHSRRSNAKVLTVRTIQKVLAELRVGLSAALSGSKRFADIRLQLLHRSILVDILKVEEEVRGAEEIQLFVDRDVAMSRQLDLRDCS